MVCDRKNKEVFCTDNLLQHQNSFFQHPIYGGNGTGASLSQIDIFCAGYDKKLGYLY